MWRMTNFLLQISEKQKLMGNTSEEKRVAYLTIEETDFVDEKKYIKAYVWSWKLRMNSSYVENWTTKDLSPSLVKN